MAPDDLVHLGVARGAYGVRGWVRIERYTTASDVLESVRRWWLLLGTDRRRLVVEDVKSRGDQLVAKWEDCDSKEAADSLKGAVVALARRDLPELPEGEHYLADIVGFRVVNRDGIEFGMVSGLRDGGGIRGGAQVQWLEVTGNEHSTLIPLNDRYVDAIEASSKLIRVDWQSDW